MAFETLSVLLPYMGVGAAAGVAYCLWNYFTSTSAGDFEVKRFVASLLFGIGIGFVGGYTIYSSGTTISDAEWWGLMATLFLTYQGAMSYVNRGVDWIFEYLTGLKLGQHEEPYNLWITENVLELTEAERKLGTLDAPYYRKMSEERRHNMVVDQPSNLQQMILDCVDQAEKGITWRYAIQAGSWVYLIEYGVLTGAAHYFYWSGAKVEWKPISVLTLETIRKTGKFPGYGKLT
jgi:hypothetical protein